MSLSVGDHLVIKREGKILTPDAGESYHEFKVMEYQSIALEARMTPDSTVHQTGYRVLLKVIK